MISNPSKPVITPNIAYVTTDGTGDGEVGNRAKPFTPAAAVALGSGVIVDWGVGTLNADPLPSSTPFTVTVPAGYVGYWRGAGLGKTAIVVTCTPGANGANGADEVYHEDLPDNPGTFIVDSNATDGAVGENAMPVHIHSVVPDSFSLQAAGPDGGNGGVQGGDSNGTRPAPGNGGFPGNVYLYGCGELQVTSGRGGWDAQLTPSRTENDGDIYYQGCSVISLNAGTGNLQDVDIFGTPNIVSVPGIGTASSNRIVYIPS